MNLYNLFYDEQIKLSWQFSFFFYFFGIFAEIRQTFRRSVFSAKWLFGEMAFRRSGFRQSVVHRLEISEVEVENGYQFRKEI